MESGQKVKIVVRSARNLPDNWADNGKLTVIEKNITEFTVEEMSEITKDGRVIASCLGHNLTWKEIYGKPGKPVTEQMKKIAAPYNA